MNIILAYTILYFLVALFLLIIKLATNRFLGQKTSLHDLSDSLFWVLYIIKIPTYFIKMFFNVVKIVREHR